MEAFDKLSEELARTQITFEKLSAKIERSDELLESLIEKVEVLDKSLHSSDPSYPGMNTRIDRIEQSMLRNALILNWIFGGGVLSAIGTLVMILKLASMH